MTHPDGQALGIFFRNYPGSFARCWAPGPECPNEAIRAHSIQNRGAIELLGEDNHVIAVKMKFGSGGPSVEFGDVGRNRASTFHGLCATHDTEIFSPIETQGINLDDSVHLFLLAYRAVLRELQVCSQMGVMAQKAYIERVDTGLDPKNQPSPTGVFALGRLMVAYETAMFKSAFDTAYLEQRYDDFEHDILIFEGCRPSLAASVLFSLDGNQEGAETPRVALTVLPVTETRTAAIVSYTQVDAPPARAALSDVLESTGGIQQYALSRRVLNHSENFILAPAFYRSWNGEKREAVRDYFVRTLFQNDLATESEHLDLFWPVA